MELKGLAISTAGQRTTLGVGVAALGADTEAGALQGVYCELVRLQARSG